MVTKIKLAKQILEMVETLRRAAFQLYDIIDDKKANYNEFVQLMFEMLSKMTSPLQQLSIEEPAIMSPLMCKNVIASLLHVVALKETLPKRACQKIEFELLPLINELYVDLYFWGLCYPDREKMWNYYRKEMPLLCPLPSEENGTYRYEVSIVVVAYNKLEYTKLCVEYLEKYFPNNISHELILVNNGSDDGTMEFFESICSEKQIDIKYNTKCFSAVSRIIEGKYVLFVSNDVLYTPHAVENMLTCIKSDETIGCVVPTCPNVSNLQTFSAQYSNLNEMFQFAEQNNKKSDPFRWEQRTRLIMPTVLARSNTVGIHAFFGYLYPFYKERFLAFPDDLMSFVLRRNGLKCVLAKDAYVYHFGSVTIREDTEKNQLIFQEGRSEFERIFRINPWGIGFCFDPTLMEALSPQNNESVNILGVNCGMGSNPLKIKEILLEEKQNSKVKIYNITDRIQYEKDQKGVSDHFQFIQNWNKKVGTLFPEIVFSYIIVEDIDKRKNAIKIINNLFIRLSNGGKMAVKSDNMFFLNGLEKLSEKHQRIKSWIIVEKTGV